MKISSEDVAQIKLLNEQIMIEKDKKQAAFPGIREFIPQGPCSCIFTQRNLCWIVSTTWFDIDTKCTHVMYKEFCVYTFLLLI